MLVVGILIVSIIMLNSDSLEVFFYLDSKILLSFYVFRYNVTVYCIVFLKS